MGGNFLTAQPPGRLGWAAHETSAGVTAQLLAALPAPDVAVDQPTANLKYNHRRLKDGEAYYLFNEGDAPVKLNVTLTHAGRAAAVQDWNPRTGEIHPITGTELAKNHTSVPLEFAPWEAKLVVIVTR